MDQDQKIFGIGGARRRITKRLVDALRPGETLWDGEVRGFGVRLQRRDPSFVYKYVWRGRQRFHTIGRHGAFTVDAARAEAKRIAGLVATGVDPAEAKKAGSAQITVGELCAVYMRKGPAFKTNKKASSWYTDNSNIKRHVIPLLGTLLAQEISEPDVVRFVAQVLRGETRVDLKLGPRRRAVVRGGPGIAARSLAVLGAVFSFGIRLKLVTHNPTKGVKAPRSRTPGRFLTHNELVRLGRVLQEYRPQSRDGFVEAIIVLALTGCRRSEVTNLRWSEVDLNAGLIRLANSKAGPRVVPLGEHAIARLAALKGAATSRWVFPSARGDGPIVGIQKVWSQMRSRAGLSDVRLHDLRHSFASYAINGGASLYLTGAILGHRQSSTTQRYAHLQASVVQQIASEVSKSVSEALTGAAH